MAGKRGHRGFGHVRKLPSGTYQASYLDPTGAMRQLDEGDVRPVRYNAPTTFQTREDAEAWLGAERRLISEGRWTAPPLRQTIGPLTFAEYSTRWLDGRRVKGRALQARTRDNYDNLLERHILPTFGDLALNAITRDAVDRWHDRCAVGKPTTRAHAYSLLRTILHSAVVDKRIDTNPAQIRGGGSTERVRIVRPASLDELEEVAAAMPERQQLMVLLAAWCALRFGELAELRRGDVDTKVGVLRIRRAVVRTRSAGTVTKAPKSSAGVRDVAIPPHLLPMVRQHLLEHAAPGKNGLLFATADGEHLAHSTFYGRAAVLNHDGTIRRAGWGWREARRVAGREDLRFHDLRHTGAVMAAQTGATLAELMARLGHATPAAAMRYQHAGAERDQEIARRLSELAQTSDPS